MTTKYFPWLDSLVSTSEQSELRRALASHHSALTTIPSRIAILGAAEEGQRLAGLCDQHGVEIAAIFDDSRQRQGTTVGMHRVESSAALDELDHDMPIIIASHRTVDASRTLKARGFQNVSPFAVLQVLYGQHFPPHMFHVGWFEDLWENRQRYASLATRLGDDASRKVLDAVIGYRQTLMPELLADIVRPRESYVPKDLFVFREDEIYIDGGAFDGDTTRLFIERADGRYARVYCFEPDPTTYPRLEANFAGETRVLPVNAGLWSKADTLRFHNDAGRASILDNSGEIEVRVVALDDVLNGERASIVKMNIEGAELEALRGAALTIRRYRPRLAIAAYHRPSDLWQIADVIEEIAPGYEFYLRQHDGGIIETVLYAVQSQTNAD